MHTTNAKLLALAVILLVTAVSFSWSVFQDEDFEELVPAEVEIESADRPFVRRAKKAPRATDEEQTGNSSREEVLDVGDQVDPNLTLIEITGGGHSDASIRLIRTDARCLGIKRLTEERKVDPVGFFRTYGTHFKADQFGRVRIPRIKESYHVAAISKFGFVDTLIGPYSQPKVTMNLAPISRMSVRVLDLDGKPVSDVEVVCGCLLSPSWNEPKVRREIFRSSTQDDGSAVLNVTANLTFARDRWSDPFLGLRGLLKPRVFVPFDPDNIPTEIVDLQLGPVGAIDLTFLNPDGSVCHQDIRVSIRIMGKGEQNPPTSSDVDEEIDGSTPWRSKKGEFELGGKNERWQKIKKEVGAAKKPDWQGWAKEGRLRIPCVSPDLTLAVTAQGGESSGLSFVSKTVQGPTAAKQSVPISIAFETKHSETTGRLLDALGSHLGRRKAQGQFLKGGLGAKLTFWTDNDGRFRVFTDRSFREPHSADFFRITVAGRQSGLPLMASVPLSTSRSEADDYVLGAVTMAPVSILAMGKIVDSNGTPVSGASIYVELGHLPVEQRTTQELHVIHWPNWPRSDEDGNFVLFGTCHASSIQLNVFCEGYAPALVLAAKGETGVRIPMRRASKVTGRLVLPTDLKGLNFEVEFAPSESPMPKVVLTGRSWNFEARQVPPGRFRLIVKTTDVLPYVLFETHDFVVVEGENLNLGDLAVPDMTRWVEFNRKGGSGYLYTHITLKDSMSGEVLTKFSMVEGSKKFLLRPGSIDVHVHAKGKREIILRNQTGTRIEFEFQAGIPIQLVFETPQEIPAGYSFSIEVGGLEAFNENELVSKTGSHEFFLPRPGTFKVSGRLLTGQHIRQSETDLIESNIEVKDQSEVQVFRVRLKDGGIEDVVRELKKLGWPPTRLKIDRIRRALLK
ncbi:MAG: hypothetical protein ACI97A_001739 [Planctomycetota bacterium]|jgi:hypothetical protein